MPVVTIIFGLALVALGLGGYFGTGQEHPTALIPAAVGVALALLGMLALKDSLRKHAMHAAAGIGLLGAVAGIVRMASAGVDFAKTASQCTVLMTLLCAAFVACCVQSFIAARRRRARTLDDTPAR